STGGGVMLGATEWLLIVFAALVAVTAVFLVGVWQFGSGLDQKSAFAARNPRSEADRAERRPLAVLDRVLRRTGFGKFVHRRMLAAGMTMRTSTFVVIMALAMVTTVALTWHYLA